MLWTRCVYRRPYRARTYVRAPPHGHGQQTDRQTQWKCMWRSAVWSAVEMCILKNRIQRRAIADCVACRYVRMQRDGKYASGLVAAVCMAYRAAYGKIWNRVNTVFASRLRLPFSHSRYAVIVWCTAADRKEMNANDKLNPNFFLQIQIGIHRGWREKSLTKWTMWHSPCRCASQTFKLSQEQQFQWFTFRIQLKRKWHVIRNSNFKMIHKWPVPRLMGNHVHAYLANSKCKQKNWGPHVLSLAYVIPRIYLAKC